MATFSNSSRFVKGFLRFKTIPVGDISDVYRQKIRKRTEEIIELIREKSSKVLQSERAKKMRTLKEYYQLEMSPPKISEMPQLMEDVNLVKEFMKNKCYAHITIRQAWLLFLVGTEIFLWFFIGETIAKRHIVGYKV